MSRDAIARAKSALDERAQFVLDLAAKVVKARADATEAAAQAEATAARLRDAELAYAEALEEERRGSAPTVKEQEPDEPQPALAVAPPEIWRRAHLSCPKRVAAFFRAHPGLEVSAADLADAGIDVATSNLNSALKRVTDSGTIERVRQGVYRLAESSDGTTTAA